MNQIETASATPEELVQMLETQLAVARARREPAGRHRAMLLVGGVLFIFIAAGAALLVLAQMTSELAQRERRPPASTAGKF